VWRCAAGLLPLGKSREVILREWPRAASNLREEYQALKDRLVVDPNASEDDGQVLFDPMGFGSTVDNSKPGHGDQLSSGADDPWSTFHRDQEMLDEIGKDLERLFPTGCEPSDFFSQTVVSNILKQVLFIWCKLHPRTGYRQGMDELAAPLLYCLYREAIPSRKAASKRNLLAVDPTQNDLFECLSKVLDLSYLEHDLFWLFERMMRDMEPLFLVSNSKKMTSKKLHKDKKALIKKRK
jgi:hypothetical protein